MAFLVLRFSFFVLQASPAPPPPAPPGGEAGPPDVDTDGSTPPAERDARRPDGEPPAGARGADQHAGEVSTVGPTGATVRGRRRPARYGLTVQFASWPDDPELGRLVDSTVWINEAHPAYRRAARSRALSYHTALAVAAPLAVDRAEEHGFVTEFLAQWGRSGNEELRTKD